MSVHRRRFLHLAAGAAAVPAVCRLAWAQGYPARPVRLVVGTAAGSVQDILSRVIAQWLAEQLGHPFVIDNRVGAGTNLATEAVVRAPADGYTLLSIGPSSAVNATLYPKLGFNFIRDIAPVASMVHQSQVVVVNPSVPVKTMGEFVAYAKANPGKVNFASSGVGTGNQLAVELFKMVAGVDMVHVPYRGAGPAMIDLIAGQVQVMFVSPVVAMEHIKSGKLRALAVTTFKRDELLPELPPVAETVPGYEFERLVRPGRAAGHAGRDRRVAQQDGQCRACRPQDAGALYRPRRRDRRQQPGRIRQADRRRDREVGQSGQVRGAQAGLTRQPGNPRDFRRFSVAFDPITAPCHLDRPGLRPYLNHRAHPPGHVGLRRDDCTITRTLFAVGSIPSGGGVLPV